MTLCAIRADASQAIGSGHIMRTLALADALKALDTEVTFICRAHPGHLGYVIADRGYSVHWLAQPPAIQDPFTSDTYEAWLGVPWQQDLADTQAVLGTLDADWLVVDHYGLDDRWEQAMRSLVKRILVLDDLADRQHDCDVLLNQSIKSAPGRRYQDLVTAECQTLIGPNYALLSPAYAELHDVAPFRTGQIQTMLIYFGGSDLPDLTGSTLAAVLALERPEITVDIVVGASYAHASRLARLASGHAKVTVHSSLPSLAPLMMAADLAIGGAGTTSWERICLRLPALVIAMAENQMGIARELNDAGAVKWIGGVGISQVELQAALEQCLALSIEEGWPNFGNLTIDGHGAARVAAVMLADDGMDLTVRRATANDEALLLEWANDPETRSNAFSTAQILPHDHHKWFASRLAAGPGCLMLLIQTLSGIPVGHVRFERTDGDWSISYVVAPEFRRRGMGRRILEMTLPVARTVSPQAGFRAQVKPDNQASKRVFERLEFEQFSADDVALKWRLNSSKPTARWD